MIIGIMGGIGCGKSVVLNLMKEEHGFEIFETDSIAHELMKPEMSAYKKIVKSFGKEILAENSTIDRLKLGKEVFESEKKLQLLNSIVHPEVINYIKTCINEKKRKGFYKFVIESAILIESGCYKMCDKLVYVYADRNTRIERLKKYRGYDENRIKSVMANQINEIKFSEMADYVIDNNGDISETKKMIKELLHLLL